MDKAACLCHFNGYYINEKEAASRLPLGVSGNNHLNLQ